MTEKNIPRIHQIRTFLEENPSDPFLMFALAKEYEKLHDLEAASEQYRKLVRQNPDYVGAYYHFGSVLRTLGKEQEAQEIFQIGMMQARKSGDQHALAELQRIAAENDEIF